MTTYLFLLQHYTQILKRFTHWCCTLIFYIIFRFSKSDYRWADNRFKNFKHKAIKKGEIYQFEFGKNFYPEMSYEHRGLVIGVKQKLLYVLPIFSYNPDKHIDIYHPIDFPLSKSHLFLLKKGFLSPSSST